MFTFAGHATGRSLGNIWRVFSHFAVRRRILISVATWSRELLKHTLFHKFIHVRYKYKGNDKLPLVKLAKDIYHNLKVQINGMIAFDDRGNIGKRYYSQDEIGTPWCVTVDFETLNDESVTVRDRDSMEQERVSIDKLTEYFQNKINTA